MRWVSRITAIGIEMVLPGIVGQWADRYFQTTFLTLTGFILGLAIAGYHLFAIATEGQSKRDK